MVMSTDKIKREKSIDIIHFIKQLKLSNYNFENTINIRCLDCEKLPRFENSYNLKDKESLEQLKKLFESANKNAWHYYYVPNNSNGFTVSDVVNCQVLFVEFDDIPKNQQFKKIKNLGIPFTYCVETLKSIHFYWTLTEPLNLNDWVSYQKQLIQKLGSDKSICNPNRLMRVSGVPYPNADFAVNLIENTGKPVDVSAFKFDIPQPDSYGKRNKIEREEYKDLNYGTNCPLSDLSQRFADEIEQLFTWPEHNFISDGRGKYRGGCPFHESKSNTSFWVEQNDSGVFSWACPQCTDNQKKNLLLYKNMLQGDNEQPKGQRLLAIEQKIYNDVFGTQDDQKEVDMNSVLDVDLVSLSKRIANDIHSSNSIEFLCDTKSLNIYLSNSELKYDNSLDINVLFKEINKEYINLSAIKKAKTDSLDLDSLLELNDEEFEKKIFELERKSSVSNLFQRRVERLDRMACKSHLEMMRKVISEPMPNYEDPNFYFPDHNPYSDMNLSVTCKIFGIKDIRTFKKKLENFESDLLDSKQDINIFVKILNDNDCDVNYLIPNYIPEDNLIILGSDPGTGKSLLVADLALAVIQPETKKFLGQTCTLKDGDVLYINNDENAKTVADRFLSLGLDKNLVSGDNPKFHYYSNVTDLKEQIHKIESKICEINRKGKCKLIIMDSLTSLTQNGEVDENHANFAKPLVKLSDLASRYNCSIVLLHHTNKMGSISGTNRLTSACHSVYVINREKELPDNAIDNSKNRVLKCIKNRTGILFSNEIEINPKSLWAEKGAYELTMLQKTYNNLYYESVRSTFINKITSKDISLRSEFISIDDLSDQHGKSNLVATLEELCQKKEVEFNSLLFKYRPIGKYRDNILSQALGDNSEIDINELICNEKEKYSLECLKTSVNVETGSYLEETKEFVSKLNEEVNKEKDELKLNENKDGLILVEPKDDLRVDVTEVIKKDNKDNLSDDIIIELNNNQVNELFSDLEQINEPECKIEKKEHLEITDKTVEDKQNNDLDEKSSAFFNYAMSDGRVLREHINDADVDCVSFLKDYKSWQVLIMEFNLYSENSPDMLSQSCFLQHSKKLFIDCLRAFDFHTIMNIEKSETFSSHINNILQLCKLENIKLFDDYQDVEEQE